LVDDSAIEKIVGDQQSIKDCYISTLKGTIPCPKYETRETSQSSKRQLIKQPNVIVIISFRLDNIESNNLEYNSRVNYKTIPGPKPT